MLHPFAMAWQADGYLMFHQSHSRIFVAYSQDSFNWEKLGDTGIRGADTDVLVYPDGTLRIYFGDISPETSGVVYTGTLTVE